MQKNKTADTSFKNTNRLIALVTAASKLFEMLQTYLITYDHQFGFKATDMCIFTIKILVKYYTVQDILIHTCLLDARKAFDWTLFAKLIETDAL